MRRWLKRIWNRLALWLRLKKPPYDRGFGEIYEVIKNEELVTKRKGYSDGYW